MRHAAAYGRVPTGSAKKRLILGGWPDKAADQQCSGLLNQTKGQPHYGHTSNFSLRFSGECSLVS